MIKLLIIIFIAFIFDLLIGDPVYRLHPIRLIGVFIKRTESGLRKHEWNGRKSGTLLTVFTSLAITMIYLLISSFLKYVHPTLYFIFNLYICYSCLALGDLLNHMTPIIMSLKKENIIDARNATSMVVGRDVNNLDQDGIIRAAIETMAENFVDGFLSPLFWFIIGAFISGLFFKANIQPAIVLMLIFKTASTLDSMVGYKNKKYYYFGWAGAKFDDIMNFLPARLSILLLFIGAVFTRQHPFKGLKTALRDRLKHESPNAAHPESFIAGALELRLGGPLKYPEGIKYKPWLGDGTGKIEIDSIYKAKTLIRYTGWISIICFLSLFLFIY